MLPGPVCVSVTPATVADVFSAPLGGADCIEARLDYLENPEESAGTRWDRIPVPLIATCRGREWGGRFAGSVADEVRILRQALADGARFVDIDFRLAEQLAGAEVIGSYHNFETTPEDLEDVLDRVCRGPAAVAKVATMVRSWSDNRRLFDLMRRDWPKPVVIVGMGAMGQPTRILGPSRGTVLTYTASDGGHSAPGQLALEELLETYRFRRIGPGTRLVGIVGNPVGHSLSPRLHNQAFAAAGLDYVYLKFPVEALDDFFEQAEALGIVGFSVTIPHKVDVVRRLRKLTPEARAAGAVNTVYRSRGEWTGDNTDVHGVRESIKHISTQNKKVVILGTGGAARAAVAALHDAGEVTLLTRSGSAGTLEWSREVRIDSIDNIDDYRPDLLINATPVGMAPDADRTPVPGPIRAETVLDMVYTPARTRLLAEADEQGRSTISGTTMFLAQAARQFEIWTDRRPPEGTFRTLDS